MEYGVTRAESDEDSKNKIIHTSEQTYFQICFVASRLLDSYVFVHHSHKCIYFQMVYNTIDFYECKLNVKLQINYLQKDT